MIEIMLIILIFCTIIGFACRVTGPIATQPNEFNLADIEAGNNPANATVLISAAVKGHKDIVELPIDRGADIEAKANDGTTALMAATRVGHKDIVEILQRAKAKK